MIDFTAKDLKQIRDSAIDLDLAALNIIRIEPNENNDYDCGHEPKDKSKSLATRSGLVFGGMESLDCGLFKAAQIKSDEPKLGKPEVSGEDFKALCRDTNLKPVDSAPIAGGRHQTVLAAAYRWEWLDRDIADDANAGKDFLAWSQRYRSEIKSLPSDLRDRIQAIWDTRELIKYETLGESGSDWITFPRVSADIWKRVAKQQRRSIPKDLPTNTNALSVAFWEWVRDERIPIKLTEGIKKALAALSKGVPCVSAPGVHMAVCKRYQDADRENQVYDLSPSLATFSACKLTIAFDSDTKPKTIATVNAAIVRTGNAAIDAGFTSVKVATWDAELGKGLDDVIANGHDVIAVLRQAKPFKKWLTATRKPRKPRKILLPCDRPANARINNRFLDSSVASLLPRKGIAIVESPKGSGKSKACVKPLVDEFKSQGKRILSVVPIINLGIEQGEKFGLASHETIGYERAKMPGLAVWVTWDSLDRLWQDCDGLAFDLVIVDEARSGLDHLHTASTDIGKGCNRARGIAALKAIVKASTLTIALDADNLTTETEYLASIDPSKPVFTLLNEALPTPKTYKVWGNRSALEEHAIAVAASSPDPCLLFIDSQKQCEALDIEISRVNPNRKVLRIDSKTPPELRAVVMASVDGYCKAHGIDVLIYSPSICSGVSLEAGYFTGKHFAFSFGVLESCKFRQGLARDRRATEWDIWIKPEDHLTDNPGLTRKEVLANLKGRNQFAPDTFDRALEIARERIANDPTATHQSILDELTRIYKQGTWDDPDLNFWGDCVARSNVARAANKITLTQDLKILEGADVFEIECDSPDESPLEAAKDEILDTDTDLTLEGVQGDLSADMARSVLRNRKASHQEIMRARGVLLRDDLPGFEIDHDFVKEKVLSDRKWMSAAKLRWMLERPDIAKERDARALGYFATSGKVSPQDLKLWSSRVALGQKLGLVAWATLKGTFTATDDCVKEYATIAKQFAGMIQKCFAVTFEEKRPVGSLRNLLKAIGVKLQSKKSNGKWIYSIAESDPVQREIIEAIQRKWDADHPAQASDIALEIAQKTPDQNEGGEIAKTIDTQGTKAVTYSKVTLSNNQEICHCFPAPEPTPIAVPIAVTPDPIPTPIEVTPQPTWKGQKFQAIEGWECPRKTFTQSVKDLASRGVGIAESDPYWVGDPQNPNWLIRLQTSLGSLAVPCDAIVAIA